MKRILNKLCVVAAALVMVLTFTQCAKDTLRKNIFGKVEVSLTATKGDMTRTELEANGTEMTVTWSEGDKLYVVGATDGLLGYLTLKSGGNTGTATFGGTLDYLSAKQNVHFYYVGTNKEIKSGSDTYAFDLSKQAGTLDAIEDSLHVMYGTKENVEPSTVNFGAVAFSNLISIVKVDTKTAFGEVSGIKLGGTCASASIDLKSATATPAVDTITLTGNASNSCYIALLENGEQQILTFKKDDKSYSLPAKTIVKGQYYSAAGKSIYLDGYTEDNWNYGPGIEINGVIWAPVNCGIGYNHAYPYGKLYQWGRKNGQGYNDGTTYTTETAPTVDVQFTGNNGEENADYIYIAETDVWDWIANSVDTYWSTSGGKGAFDPCPTGWRVPTKSEWESLVGGKTDFTYVDGVHGVNVQKGLYFNGTPTATSGVFVPAAGYLSGNNGSACERGISACYWASTVSSPNKIAWGFTRTAVETQGRALGQAVRCVKKTTTTATTDTFNNKIGW